MQIIWSYEKKQKKPIFYFRKSASVSMQ